MSDIPSSSIRGNERIPPWRDGRIIGILLQIAFVILFLFSARWLLVNINNNITNLGAAQFICRDGTSNLRCAFDFLSADAQFDIQESVIDYEPSDSFWRAIAVGALNTLKIASFGIILTTILGTFTGIARLSNNWLVSNIAKWYIDLMRNTPLLLQLFFLYFVVFLVGLPLVGEAIQIGSIYISQRGLNYPSLVPMSSFATWVAFIVLGIVQVQLLWVILGRREEQTGQESNRTLWAILSFLVVVVIGWYVAGNNSNNEAMLVARADRIREFDDIPALIERRLSISDISELDGLVDTGELTEEAVEEAQFTICTLQDSPSEVNLTSQLRRAGVPFSVSRSDRADQAIGEYADAEAGCDAFVATTAVVAAERDLLENSADQLVVPLPETPVRISTPKLEGFNFVGGSKMSLEFSAILFGLVLYTGAFVAEIVRAGILSVSKGQTEAARALGLSETQRLRLVVLPQALRVIIPPLTSQYLNLTKNSSLALAVLYPDLYRTINTIINQSGRAIQPIVILALTYLSFSLFISFFLNWYNRRIALVER